MRKEVSPEIEKRINKLDKDASKSGSKMVDKVVMQALLVIARAVNEILKRVEDRG